jgi:hypothetical protein
VTTLSLTGTCLTIMEHVYCLQNVIWYPLHHPKYWIYFSETLITHYRPQRVTSQINRIRHLDSRQRPNFLAPSREHICISTKAPSHGRVQSQNPAVYNCF